MNRVSKTGVVLGGYAAALLLTWALFYIYVFMRKDIGSGSGGMQAFGDTLLFAGVFGLLALVPTALALYYLRPFEKFWVAFSIASLALAATGPVAALLMGRLHQSYSAAVLVGFFGLLKFSEPTIWAWLRDLRGHRSDRTLARAPGSGSWYRVRRGRIRFLLSSGCRPLALLEPGSLRSPQKSSTEF